MLNASRESLGRAARPPAPAARPLLALDGAAGGNSWLISHVVLAGSVRLVDLCLTSGSGLVVGAFYLGWDHVGSDALYLFTIYFTAIAATVIFEMLGLYSARNFASLSAQLPSMALGWTSVFALHVAAIFFLKAGPEFSRVWLALWFCLGFLSLLSSRVILALAVRSWARSGRLYRRAAIYGANGIAEALLRELETGNASDIRICGVYDERTGDRSPASVAGYPCRGGLDALIADGRANRLDLVIVALPMAAEDRLAAVAGRIAELPVDVKLPARAGRVRFVPRLYSLVGSVPMMDLSDKPITDWGYVVKAAFDKAFGFALLLTLLPVMALVAAAIKLESRGPVLFRQRRYGFNNELIEVLKFRSMHVEATDGDAARLVSRDDPRVTRVGRFIRKTSLDELPQLLNVLRGELSLVGPRPHALSAKAANELYDKAVAGYFARHRVKPGITGWAQVNGWRGETDTREKLDRRIEHDLHYIENWSVLFDLYILLRTPWALFSARNAY